MSDIISSLINNTTSRTSQISDFTPGSSVIRAIYEAISLELSNNYIYNNQNVNEGIKQGLENGFGLTQQEAKEAYGYVNINFSSILTSDVTIPQGSQFSSTLSGYDQTYRTIQPYVVPAGQSSGQVQVYCNQAGSVGNIPAGVINTCQNTISYVSTVINPEDFCTGTDAETDADFIQRFQLMIKSIGRGTVDALNYITRSVDNVTGVNIDDSETGLIKIYAHDANGDLPESMYNSIVSNIQNEYNPAGIAWEVLPVDKILANLEINVYVNDLSKITDSVDSAFTSAIRGYINSLEAGEDVSLSKVSNTIINVNPYLVTDVQVTKDPNDDLSNDVTNAQNSVNTITQNLANINATTTSAGNDLTDTANKMIDIGSSYTISVDGKNELLVYMNTINTNYASDFTLCNQYGITNTYYTSIYNTLTNMINSMNPSSDTPYQLDFTTYRNTILGYFNSRINILNQIHDVISNQLSTAQNSLLSANTSYNNDITSNITIDTNQIARPGTIDILYYLTPDNAETTTSTTIDTDTTEATTVDESDDDSDEENDGD